MTKHHISHVTRRGFIGLSASALAAQRMLGDASAAQAPSNAAPQKQLPSPDSVPMTGKIALEEHFALAEMVDSSYAALRGADVKRQIGEIGSERITEMDRGGVELCVLSLVAPGIQAIPNASQAVTLARRANDYLAEQIAKYPKRLKGFAALPLQDPHSAAQELTRCVKELGFCGAMVNGFSQTGDEDSALYYDLPQFQPFWATVQELEVPFYLHPRAPLSIRQQAYDGHPWIAGSSWGYGVETSIHALRLIGSGLFDEYPKLRLILGHLGEGLPFGIWRIDHRIVKTGVRPKAKLPIAHYLRENFYITTSGNFRTQALIDVMMEVGADRVMYSVDYPFEDMAEASNWFDHADISEPDRFKIARTNAKELFRLSARTP